jgi:hypothetical protein
MGTCRDRQVASSSAAVVRETKLAIPLSAIWSEHKCPTRWSGIAAGKGELMDDLTSSRRIAMAIGPSSELLIPTRLASRRSDRSAVRRVGEFLADERIRASARRGWISWPPVD